MLTEIRARSQITIPSEIIKKLNLKQGDTLEIEVDGEQIILRPVVAIPKEVQNPKHPSLRTKKIKGTDDIYEASINMSYRMTWQYYKDGFLLRNIGEHDKTLKNP